MRSRGQTQGVVLLASALCASMACSLRAAPSTGDRNLVNEFNSVLAVFDQAQQVQLDNPDRARQLFRSAAQRFESIVAGGVVNGRLQYNLGNCYLQAGDVGEAILHYRRAQRFIPRDPLLADNLSQARSRRLTTIQPTRRSTVLRSVFFWHYESSFASRCKAAIVLFAIVWAMLALRSIVSSRGVTVSAIVTAVLALSLATSAGVQYRSEQRRPGGVVTSMDVKVFKGPSTTYQRRFAQPLQSGVEFTLIEERPGWWNVELPDGQSGWIDSSTAALIVPTSSSDGLMFEPA
jgi:hypothetical protein